MMVRRTQGDPPPEYEDDDAGPRLTGEKKRAIAKRLEEISRRNGGILRAEDVVQDAKNRNSPLHSEFPWDLKKAAHQHWLHVARRIIVSVQVVIKTQHVVVRCPVYVRDPKATHQEPGYVALQRVRSNEDQSRALLVEEFSRVAALLRRAREIAKAVELDDEVGQFLNGILDLRLRVQEADQPSVQ